MITIISGTNRRNSRTFPIAKQIFELFRKKTVEHIELLNLEDLPLDFIHTGMYDSTGQNRTLGKLQDNYIIPTDKLFILSPEYNGSYPGILKLFIDACSIREYKATFAGKKAALAGVSTGRAGNLRGLDHLRASLNHMGTIVMPSVLPLSNVDSITDEKGYITDLATLKSMEATVESFLKF